MKKKDAAEEVKKASGFTKKQVLGSKKYRDNRDLLSAVLKDGECYSHDEINGLLQETMKRKVR